MGWLAGKYRCHPGIHPPPKYLPFSHSSPQLIRGLSLIQFYSFYIFSTFQISAGTHWRSWRSTQQRGRRRQGWQGSSCWCPSASCRGTHWRSPAGWRRSPPGWWRQGELPHRRRGRWIGDPPLGKCRQSCSQENHVFGSNWTWKLRWRGSQALLLSSGLFLFGLVLKHGVLVWVSNMGFKRGHLAWVSMKTGILYEYQAWVSCVGILCEYQAWVSSMGILCGFRSRGVLSSSKSPHVDSLSLLPASDQSSNLSENKT